MERVQESTMTEKRNEKKRKTNLTIFDKDMRKSRNRAKKKTEGFASNLYN